MEDIKRNLQETNTSSGGCGEANSGHTTRTGMGQEGYSHIFKNTNRNNRLEWRC
tara:strand:+ start:191 stop:352 length:162 start_codon:yes stop_codon:yes gene_type:complete